MTGFITMQGMLRGMVKKGILLCIKDGLKNKTVIVSTFLVREEVQLEVNSWGV